MPKHTKYYLESLCGSKFNLESFYGRPIEFILIIASDFVLFISEFLLNDCLDRGSIPRFSTISKVIDSPS